MINAITAVAAISEETMAGAEEVSATTQEQSASVEEVSALDDNLSQVAGELQKAVAVFDTDPQKLTGFIKSWVKFKTS